MKWHFMLHHDSLFLNYIQNPVGDIELGFTDLLVNLRGTENQKLKYAFMTLCLVVCYGGHIR